MNREPRAFRNRSRRGFSTVAALVWIVIVFAVYSGYKFLPVYSSERRVERAVEAALQEIDSRSTDAMIRRRIAKRATAASIPLDEEGIQIEREQGHGERIVHVAVAYPITVSYLGSEMTIDGGVHATRTIKVDGAALARLAERRNERLEEVRRHQEASAERGRKLREAMAECEEKLGKGSCEKFEMPGGDPDEIVKLY